MSASPKPERSRPSAQPAPKLRMVNDRDIREIRRDIADESANADPVTRSPGAHPAGVAAGAAVGVAAGTAAGAFAGPIGVVIGATAGGIAGGLIGKSVAESIHPTRELDYWRVAYRTRPYAVANEAFEDYEPVYRATVMAFMAAPSKAAFEAEEPRLREAYEATPGARPWTDVREASRDAWERVVRNTSQTATEAQHIAADRVNDVLRMLNDSIEGFGVAAERLEDPGLAGACRHYAAQRAHLAIELREVIAAGGVLPTSSTEIRGALARAWATVRSALGGGDRVIIENIESAEGHSVAAYRVALASDDLTNETRTVLSRQFPIVKSSHDQFTAWKHELQSR